MHVSHNTVINLSESDVIEAVTQYLVNNGLIDSTSETKIQFNISKHIEGEDLFSPGYEITKFNGCTITLNK